RNPITKVIVLGDGPLIKGLLTSLSEKTKITCEEFRFESLKEVKINIKNDNVITPVNLVSISATIPSPMTEEYNLNHAEFSKPTYSLMVKQLVVGIVLTMGLFTSLVTHYSLQTSKLTAEISSSQKEALASLKKTFKNLQDEKTLSDAIDAAEVEIKTQKETWFAFSSKSRGSFLQYLLELTSVIDAKSIGLELEQ